MRYEGSNPSLCTIFAVSSVCKRETWELVTWIYHPPAPAVSCIASPFLPCLGIAVWNTMEPGKYRALTLVLLGFFAARALIGFFQARARQG